MHKKIGIKHTSPYITFITDKSLNDTMLHVIEPNPQEWGEKGTKKGVDDISAWKLLCVGGARGCLRGTMPLLLSGSFPEGDKQKGSFLGGSCPWHSVAASCRAAVVEHFHSPLWEIYRCHVARTF